MARQIHSNAHITKLFYILKRKGLSDGLKHYCAIELRHWNAITTDELYEYLGLDYESLEDQFNNITKSKEKK